MVKKLSDIRWIAPEETIDSRESTFVDDYFAHEEYYEHYTGTLIDSSHLGSDELRAQVKMIFGDEKLF